MRILPKPHSKAEAQENIRYYIGTRRFDDVYAAKLDLGDIQNWFGRQADRLLGKTPEAEDLYLYREVVNSSNLAEVAYSPKDEIMQIIFNNGNLYEYYNVPESTYQGLVNASSHGKYFWKNIRDKYRYRKIMSNART